MYCVCHEISNYILDKGMAHLCKAMHSIHWGVADCPALTNHCLIDVCQIVERVVNCAYCHDCVCHEITSQRNDICADQSPVTNYLHVWKPSSITEEICQSGVTVWSVAVTALQEIHSGVTCQWIWV